MGSRFRQVLDLLGASNLQTLLEHHEHLDPYGDSKYYCFVSDGAVHAFAVVTGPPVSLSISLRLQATQGFRDVRKFDTPREHFHMTRTSFE